MSDQRIHQFKVFRGSSQAKARKEMACSFISKPTAQQEAGVEPIGECTHVLQELSSLQQQTVDNQQQSSNSGSDQVEIHYGLDDTTKNTETQTHINTVNRQQSLHYIYHEEDSQEPSCEHQHDMRMNESSIRLDDSEWPVVEQTKHLKLSIERMRLEEDKMKLELEKAQLQRRRKEVELLMREVTMKKHNVINLAKSTEILNETREMSSHTIKTSNSRNTDHSQQSQHSTQLETKKRRSVRYRMEEPQEPKKPIEKEEELERKVSRLQKSQQIARQQRARQALLLETLWINVIRTNNEINQLNLSLVRLGFCSIVKASHAHRLVLAVESVFSLQDLVSAGQAFIRIKKSTPLKPLKSPQPKRSLIVKFARREAKQKQNNFLQPLYSDRSRVCQTEQSRVLTEQSSFSNQQQCLTRSIEFQKGMCSSRGSPNVQIDSIIRAQLYNNKQPANHNNVKPNRTNSRQHPEAVVKQIYLKTQATDSLMGQQQPRKKDHRYATLTKIQIKNISSMLKPASSNTRRVM